MKNKVVFVTGNEHKAKYFSRMVGRDIPHTSLDLDEIQSTSLRTIVAHKARQAFELIGSPVIVEDTKLSFNALGSLPGPFIKWFLDELDVVGLCRMLDGYSDRGAVAGAAIAFFDGKTMEIFERELAGTIAKQPVGTSGFGWNRIFIPAGSDMTLGQMEESEFQKYYAQVKPFDAVAEFLKLVDEQ